MNSQMNTFLTLAHSDQSIFTNEKEASNDAERQTVQSNDWYAHDL